MPPERSSEVKFEIGHVLFIDVVRYSKLLIEEQKERLGQLTAIVLGTAQVRDSSDEQLVRLPTGDGMALVFRHSAEEPARCALEIAEALRKHPELPVRMGIHSGPVSELTDVSGRTNIAGAGINMAQRVMDCGDAGHILLSQHVADDLVQYRQWAPRLRDLGECEVKHGVRLHLVNLYAEPLGNPEPPEKFRQIAAAASMPSPVVKPKRMPWHEVVVVAVLLALLIGTGLFFFRQRAPSSAPTSRAAPPVPEKSIAVLPFENLSEEKANAFFADGVQDEILTALSRIADLKVISRTSVMHYKSGVARNLREIGQQLGVANVVEGSVQRSGNRVRVNAQLVDARTDRHLWGQTYDRDLADVFAIQSEIAKTIADQLQAKLSPAEKNAIERPPTSDVTAFDLYTRAKNLFLTAIFSNSGKGDFLQAVDLLNQAVARDPSFFDAYCQLALTHDFLYLFGFDHTPAGLASAEAAVQAAFRLRPDAGETHLARAWNLYAGYLDYEGALAELEVARQTLPIDPRIVELKGFIERRSGHWEESTRDLEHAIKLDPRNVRTLQQTALSYRAFRRYAEEKSVLDRVLVIVPNNAFTKAAHAFVELDSKADTRPLHQMIDSIRATDPAAMPSIADQWLLSTLAERDAAAAENALIASGENGVRFGLQRPDYVFFDRSFVEGVIARMTKDDSKARSAFTAARVEQVKTIQAQPNYGPALCVLGLIDAGLGRKEEALREGRRAVELLPLEKDAFGGTGMIKYLAMIAGWVGDKDLACEQLASVIHRPSDLSYGQLKLLPFWDPLRGDPRFEKILEEAKKPVALK